MTESNEIQPTTFEHFKNIFKFLSKKQYKESFSELLAFLKAVYEILKELYIKYLKGQYIEVKGKRIPRTAIAILCLVLLYLISPMSCIFSGSPQPKKEEAVATEAANTVVYDKDNIKISNIHKCDMATCGELEYTGNDDVEKIRIIISFFTSNGEKIHDSYVDAEQLAPNTRVEFTVPAEKDFGFSKVAEVQINPEDEPDEYEEEE